MQEGKKGTRCHTFSAFEVLAIGVSLGVIGLDWVAVACPGVVGLFLAYLAWFRLPRMETGRMN